MMASDPALAFTRRAPYVETHEAPGGAPISVVREDLIEGGSKMRFLPLLVEGAEEVVFGGPYCGGAPYALSVVAKHTDLRVSLFFAKRGRERWHRRQLLAQENGARIVEVPFGRMSNVQAKARRYAAEAGALFLPLGFDVPEAEEPLVEVAAGLRAREGSPDQVWVAAGSGMLARCLARAFPSSEIHAVTVGLASRNAKQPYPENVILEPCLLPFEKEEPALAPFPSDGNYERKAWRACVERRRGHALFWNVLS